MNKPLNPKLKAQNRIRLSIVVSTQPAQFQAATFKGDLGQNLAQVSELGYTGVELAVRNPQLLDLADLDYQLQVNNLQVSAIGTGQAWSEEGLSFTDPDPSVRKAAVNRVLEHIPVAESYNAVIIIGLLRGVVKPGVEPNQARKWLIEALQECSSTAQTTGVRLALEPINRYETTLINSIDQGLELIKDVGLENLGLLLDTFHMNIEEAEITTSIRSCSNKIFHFHVADSNRWYPGAGHIDFHTILKALLETGYQGWISGEFLPLPDVKTAALRNIQHLGKLLSDIH